MDDNGILFQGIIMRRWWWIVLAFALIAISVAAYQWNWFRASRTGASPLPVPDGDEEIAWLHNPTSYESWENFVWGVKRREMASEAGPSGLEVDDPNAYPDRHDRDPEVVDVSRKGFAGTRIRWYKVTDDASQEAWVHALAARDRPPIAILGGWSSDRVRSSPTRCAKPIGPVQNALLFIAQATAEEVYRPADNYPTRLRSSTTHQTL